MRYINRFTSETKLLVDARLGDDIRAWSRQRLGPDPHGSGAFRDQYGVTSVYLDTDAHDVYHRRGSYGRSKYRIRHYESDHAAFLERKLRTLMILEVKYSGVFPRIFKDLVDEFHLTPRPASKYRFAVQTLGLAGSGTATLST